MREGNPVDASLVTISLSQPPNLTTVSDPVDAADESEASLALIATMWFVITLFSSS